MSAMLFSPDHGSGSGSALNPGILVAAGLSALVATVLATLSILLQLKNYRKPILQRQVVRIMLMIPIYAISSYVSLWSLEAAVVIDAIRDLYEAFVIYNFFHLLVDYLGGERSLLILLHGRPPKHPLFPLSLFKREIDVSDPFTFLYLKRGILQYVQVKPVLAVVTLILKATGKYNEGDLRSDAGYLYISIAYNLSICISLYCLAMFWVVINDDVKPFRPMPKFLCIKGILFFCFWQGLAVSVLVKAGVITNIGPYTDVEHIALAITDTLICFEMPIFAVAHMFAFSHTDYIDPYVQYAARMRFYYALRDAFGLLDVLEDTRATLRGGVSYRTFEPVEGAMHVGEGRDRRIRAGLRYAKGGKQKYWLPMPADDTIVASGPLHSMRKKWDEHNGYAPLLAEETEDVVHEGTTEGQDFDSFSPGYHATENDDLTLHFGTPEKDEDAVYLESRNLIFGDYNYPTIDVSTERAKMDMWDEEERILRDQRAAAFAWKRGMSGTIAYSKGSGGQYGAFDKTTPIASTSRLGHKGRLSEQAKQDPSQPHPATIDYEQDRVPNIDIQGIKLGWTKSGGIIPKAGSSSGSPSRTPLKRPDIGKHASTKGDLKPEHVSDPEGSEEEAVDRRDDAIDLVVDDLKAGQEEMDQERRKGEPALQGPTGLKKVYRRKYDAENGDEEIEIQEEHDVGEEPNDLPEKVKVRMKDKDGYEVPKGHERWSENDNSPGELFSPGKETEVVITREVEPPPHARVDIRRNHILSDDEDENPWA